MDSFNVISVIVIFRINYPTLKKEFFTMSSYLVKKYLDYQLIHNDGAIINLSIGDEIIKELAGLTNPDEFEVISIESWLTSHSSSKHKFYSMLDQDWTLVVSWNTKGVEHINILNFNSFRQWIGVQPRKFELISISQFAKALDVGMSYINTYRKISEANMEHRKFSKTELSFPLPAIYENGYKWTIEQVETYKIAREGNIAKKKNRL